uniref:DNA-directed RNA polymerase I subunit rpa49 n=1 Tax=Kalanchoe fedtschenkoi TaxID=63787 RepID=A0A7N0RIN6_KALFE
MEETPTITPKKKKTKSKPYSPLKAKIQVIGRQPGKSEPIIGYFPSGYDPAAEEPEDAPEVTVLKHRKKPHRMEMVVKPQDSAVEFVGKSHAGEGAMPQRCAFALGVLDKATGTLKIVSIASDKIIRLEPKIPALEKREDEPLNQIVLAEDVPAEGRADKLKKLNQLYGTKRSVTMAKKLDALNQKHAPEVVEELEKKMKDLKTNQKALELEGAAVNNRGVPHYNIDATTPQQAYPLDRIILEGEWDYLLDIYELVQAGSALDPSSYPSFVCNRAHRLKEIQDDAERMKMACIFSYITHLIKFKDQHSADASSAKRHHIPSIVKQKLSTMFSTPEIHTLTREKISFLISHVLVLTLFADDFRTDITDIAKDLKMSSIVLRDHVQHLGCKFVRDGNKASLATLPIPLQFPDQGKRKRRR